MKLLFVAPSAYLFGGVQDWLSDLVKDLRNDGDELTIALPDGEHHRLHAYNQVYPDLRAIGFRNPTGSGEGRVRVLEHLLRQTPADLIVGVNIVDLYIAVQRLRLHTTFSSRLVMTLHAIEADYLADLRVFSNTIDALIASNRLTCLLARKISGIPEERIFYAPYGVHVPEKLFIRPSPMKCLKLAWVGRFDHNQKRAQDLPLILEQLDSDGVSYHLSIAGDGPERESLHRDLRPWIEKGMVKWLGRLSREQLAVQVYKTHHALLITSSWETGPIVAWEAMAHGMAVASSRYVGSQSEGALIHDTTVVFFPVGDVPAAAAQLARLRNPSFLANLVAQGRGLVASRYSKEASLAAWRKSFVDVRSLPLLPPPVAAEPVPASGRLDRWIGTGRAETLRRALRIQFRHASPGSEWPHSAHCATDNDRLLREASALEGHG